MKYPNKKTEQQKTKNLANLGMHLEKDIESTNLYYLNENIAIIHKKPTPIQVVNVSYPSRNKAKITEAYYKIPSTTDFNGVYKGKYIDFDVKETKSKTSMPLKNIHPHQIEHLRNVDLQGGIAFIIINFKMYDEYYFCPIKIILKIWDTKDLANERKSLTYEYIKSNAYKINFSYRPRLDYLKIVDEYYLK